MMQLTTKLLALVFALLLDQISSRTKIASLVCFLWQGHGSWWDFGVFFAPLTGTARGRDEVD